MLFNLMGTPETLMDCRPELSLCKPQRSLGSYSIYKCDNNDDEKITNKMLARPLTLLFVLLVRVPPIAARIQCPCRRRRCGRHRCRGALDA